MPEVTDFVNMFVVQGCCIRLASSEAWSNHRLSLKADPFGNHKSSPSLPRGFPMKTFPHYPQQPALITRSYQNKQLWLGTLHLFSYRSHSNVPTKNQKISVTYWLFLDKERATVCLGKKFQFFFFLHRHKARHFYTIFGWRCVYNNIYNICNKL